MAQKTVKVFSTPTCPYCVMVKQFLDENKIKYEDINVAEDQKSAMEMFKKSQNMGVPQLWIDDDVVLGFDPDRISDLLGL